MYTDIKPNIGRLTLIPLMRAATLKFPCGGKDLLLQIQRASLVMRCNKRILGGRKNVVTLSMQWQLKR